MTSETDNELKRLRPVVDELKDQRLRLEQLYKERQPGVMEYRLAEALRDTLDALAVAEREAERCPSLSTRYGCAR
jgi:hypothetical protein